MNRNWKRKRKLGSRRSCCSVSLDPYTQSSATQAPRSHCRRCRRRMECWIWLGLALLRRLWWSCENRAWAGQIWIFCRSCGRHCCCFLPLPAGGGDCSCRHCYPLLGRTDRVVIIPPLSFSPSILGCRGGKLQRAGQSRSVLCFGLLSERGRERESKRRTGFWR
ncbi:unnamed protein product [Linum tenue]|uniref:Uncharacterized protein n=1 Tax=Linum tenue TaxID=586396 RepID=A0AAV0MNP9_9ROSI|nr:unnamed protein product [Linum tenue]